MFRREFKESTTHTSLRSLRPARVSGPPASEMLLCGPAASRSFVTHSVSTCSSPVLHKAKCFGISHRRGTKTERSCDHIESHPYRLPGTELRSRGTKRFPGARGADGGPRCHRSIRFNGEFYVTCILPQLRKTRLSLMFMSNWSLQVMVEKMLEKNC